MCAALRPHGHCARSIGSTDQPIRNTKHHAATSGLQQAHLQEQVAHTPDKAGAARGQRSAPGRRSPDGHATVASSLKQPGLQRLPTLALTADFSILLKKTVPH
ncbi:hypothetical protein AAFF_G00394270 [Aldrovandia affinis]|uniref:Uncharacterized protein n=1 Tax=Aldrovandia affinis TaxID=143900 RepID=A0AAD7SDT7_9TELE|nr:hypothetical protein AAFF_G00394270 [Aldrovandia affinis]